MATEKHFLERDSVEGRVHGSAPGGSKQCRMGCPYRTSGEERYEEERAKGAREAHLPTSKFPIQLCDAWPWGTSEFDLRPVSPVSLEPTAVEPLL